MWLQIAYFFWLVTPILFDWIITSVCHHCHLLKHDLILIHYKLNIWNRSFDNYDCVYLWLLPGITFNFDINEIFSYFQLSVDIKMKNYKINTSSVSPEGPKSLDNKSGINFMNIIFIFWKIVCNTMLFMIFQYRWEPVLIH